MRSMSRAGLALLAVAAVAAPAFAQDLAKERGNIVSTNWSAMQVEIKDPKGRVATWKVQRDAEVVFTDKKSQFPNPKLADLRAPMYVHFTFDAGTKVVQKFEVVEVGFEPAQGGPGVQQKAVVTNLDPKVGQIEVTLDPGGRKTFEVDPKSLLSGVQQGDNVTLLIETRGGREVVTRITKQAGAAAGPAPRKRRP
ncbi:MAG TPA: hypothetical protein VL691_20565 [Vicinamibacteria bacterium]|nr:hypothetical protein [Vicinamibacteria bacterium]